MLQRTCWVSQAQNVEVSHVWCNGLTSWDRFRLCLVTNVKLINIIIVNWFVAAVVVDLSRKRQRMAIDENVVKLLQEYRNVPSILVLNKVTGFTVCCKSYTALQSLFSEAASCSQVDTVRDKFSILPVIDRLTCKKLLDPLKTGGNGLKYTPDAGEDGVVSLNEGGWPNFHEVLVVSAASGEGINTLLVSTSILL